MPEPAGLTMRDVIGRNARWRPDADAYVQDGRRLTHGAYAERVAALASWLASKGLDRGDRVAILSMNSLEYCEVVGACEWGGFVAVTINFRLTAAEIAFVLADSTPRALVYEARYAPTVAALAERLMGVELICVGADDPVAAAYGAAVDRFAGEDLAKPPSAEDLVYLIYTSGTTGRPKGVLSSHRRAVRLAEVMGGELETTPGGRTLLNTPLFHVGALNMRAAQVWRGGACIVMAQGDAAAIAEVIARERVSTAFMVPTQLQTMLDLPGSGALDLTSLTTLSVAGAPIPVPLLRRALARLGPVLIVQYGMTEGQGTTLYKPELAAAAEPGGEARIGSIGHAHPQGRLKIAGDGGAPLGPGEVGEICLANPTVMDGYWNNPEATVETIRDGWLHTGDVGYADAERFVFLVDRKKDVIISGGENIYSREVEEALHAHPAVVEAAVVGAPDAHWGEVVAAFVVARPDASLTADALVDHARGLIARYKCPKTVELVSELPRLPTGKVDKKALRERVRAAQA